MVTSLVDSSNHAYTSNIVPGSMSANFEELKAKIDKELEKYFAIEATDENLKLVKGSLAYLRAFKKEMSEQLKSDLTIYNKPATNYKLSFDIAVSSVDEGIRILAEQVDDIVSKQKDSKKQLVDKIIDESKAELSGEVLAFVNSCETFFSQTWLNKTVSEKTVTEEVKQKIEDISAAYALLNDGGKHAAYMLSEYKRTGNLSACITLRNRLKQEDEQYALIQKGPGEEEKSPQPEVSAPAMAEPDPEPIPDPIVPISDGLVTFTVSLTAPQDFMDSVIAYATQNGFACSILYREVSL